MGGNSPRGVQAVGGARISVLLRVLGAVLLLAGATAYWTGVGSTAPSDQFEITDGNIVDNSQAPAPNIPDWDTIFGTVSDTDGFLTTAFNADPISSDPLPVPPCLPDKTGDLTTFTSAGSDKTEDPITSWTYQSGSVPNAKDDLTNVYAAAAMDGTDTVFYFALERAEVNGSAHVDFEFLKSPVGLQQGTDKDGPTVDSSGCPKGAFTGSRSVDDILVSMELTIGGVTGTPVFRKWDGDSYEVFTPAAGEVGFTSNSSTTPIACGDWVCRDKFGSTITQLPQHSFMEGFINVTQALDTAPGCYSTFLAKTRTSGSSGQSELKDFALSEFDTCDAFITLTPNDINEVAKTGSTSTHTFTAHVETNDTGVYLPKSGATVNFTLAGVGSFTPATPTSCSTNGSGDCTITITSTAYGLSTVNASTTVTVGGQSKFRSTATDSGPGGSGPAYKHWVDAYLKVTPSEVNPVGEAHTFTFEYGVLKGAPASGVADTILTFGTPTITPAISPAVTPTANTCTTPGPQLKSGETSTWTCSVTINSSTPTIYEADATASSTVTMGGDKELTLNRSTATAALAGPGGNTGATKQYVDLRIKLAPDGLNEADNPATTAPEDPHTVTATVEWNDGSGNGSTWAAVNGATVTFSKTATSVGEFVGADNDCVTNTSGQCTVQINSSAVGTTVVNATTTVVLNTSPNTVTITRSTDTAATGGTQNATAGGSGPITKKWVNAFIRVVEDDTNEVDDDHTFTITVTPQAPTGVSVSNVSISPTVVGALKDGFPITDCDSNVPVVSGTAECTYTINSLVPGVFEVDASTTVGFSYGAFTQNVTRSTSGYAGPGGNEGATKEYVDAAITIGDDGVNFVGDEHLVTATATKNPGTGWVPAEGETITLAIEQGPGTFVGGGTTTTCVAGTDGSCFVHIVSDTPGVTWVSASTSYAVGTINPVTLNRTTANDVVDPATDDENLRKEWVSAEITITPDAVNEVRDAHVFDIVISGTSTSATITIPVPSWDVEPDPATAPVLACDAQDGGSRECTLTINSNDPGVFTASAWVTVTIGDQQRTVYADGEVGNNPAAVKTYVDARISLRDDGVNEVGDPHPVTALVEINDGTNGWVGAGNATVEFSTDLGNIPASCLTDGSGECTVDLTSDAPGVSTVSAEVTLSVLGESITRDTGAELNTYAGGSDDLVKRWVDGAISITPDAVNPVGAEHEFDITVVAIPSGSGTPAFVITPRVSPAPDALDSTCDEPVLSENGNTASCTVTINNNEAGVFVAHVDADITVGGVTITRSTDSEVGPAGDGGSGPAQKVYVDANIQVTPDGVNAVGDPHTVTGHVNVDNGTGSANASDGTEIAFEIESGPGSLSAESCDTAGGTGSCSVTLNSAVAGVTVVSASSSVTIDGVTLDLATNGSGANSGNLTKRWIDAFITIGPSAVNPLNEPHTFDVAVTAIPSGASPVSFDLVTTSVNPNPTSVASTCENPVVSGNTATCTLTINSSSAGLFTANATATVSVDGATVTRSTDTTVASAGPGGSGPATKEYVAVLGTVLVRTGIDAITLIAVGAALVAFGLNLVLVAKRRRRRPALARR